MFFEIYKHSICIYCIIRKKFLIFIWVHDLIIYVISNLEVWSAAFSRHLWHTFKHNGFEFLNYRGNYSFLIGCFKVINHPQLAWLSHSSSWWETFPTIISQSIIHIVNKTWKNKQWSYSCPSSTFSWIAMHYYYILSILYF